MLRAQTIIMNIVAVLLGLILVMPSAAAQDSAGDAMSEINDTRQLVEMPPQVQAMLRQDMRAHLHSLHAIIAALAEQRLEAAADIASQQLGSASMGRHRDSGGGPGRHMPAAMRSIGMRMHAAADALAEDLAAAANTGDQTAAMQQLAQVTAACSACHAAYRIR
ncbi:MAG: hypothetical protein Tsb0027_20770 [Wenzhouxiangellaceae bacterium]